jgi:hypothetical protein
VIDYAAYVDPNQKQNGSVASSRRLLWVKNGDKACVVPLAAGPSTADIQGIGADLLDLAWVKCSPASARCITSVLAFSWSPHPLHNRGGQAKIDDVLGKHFWADHGDVLFVHRKLIRSSVISNKNVPVVGCLDKLRDQPFCRVLIEI